MPRGGKNHAQGGGEIAQGGKNFARVSRAQDSIFLPPLANFSCTPLPKTLLTCWLKTSNNRRFWNDRNKEGRRKYR